MNYKRNRILYGIIIIIVIVLGLVSRKVGNFIYLGDALWALMIFIGLGCLFKSMDTKKLALTSIVFCYMVELSQLYHVNWIDNIRSTTLGGLVLGYSFLWSDILAYTMGVILGMVLEILIKYKN